MRILTFLSKANSDEKAEKSMLFCWNLKTGNSSKK